jgi:hypothetical protein
MGRRVGVDLPERATGARLSPVSVFLSLRPQRPSKEPRKAIEFQWLLFLFSSVPL